MTLKNNRAHLLGYFKLCVSIRSHLSIQTGVTVRKRQIWVKISHFLSCVTMKFDRWPWKTIGHLFYATSSLVHHFIAICEFKVELQSGNSQFGSKLAIFDPCDLEIWRMTLKNNRAPLLCFFKLCASFHSHLWIQNGATVQKHQIWVKIGHFCLVWPWNLAEDLETHLFYATSSFVHHFIAIHEFKLELQSGNG